ncbi:unnamed protein product [Cercospora beticola]|nr:unnamed protein product [Cercospora beticola]
MMLFASTSRPKRLASRHAAEIEPGGRVGKLRRPLKAFPRCVDRHPRTNRESSSIDPSTIFDFLPEEWSDDFAVRTESEKLLTSAPPALVMAGTVTISTSYIEEQTTDEKPAARTTTTQLPTPPPSTSPKKTGRPKGKSNFIFRRPRHTQTYYSRTAGLETDTSFASIREARRRILTHVGRIEETPAGMKRPDPCVRCVRKG